MELRPDLSGRTALVTGSAGRVGEQVLYALADHGADVAVHYYSSEDEATETAENARERDVETTTVQADVTDPESVDAAFDAVESDLGHVDVLVNCVGDFAPEHWRELSFEDWQRVLATNLYGTMLCSRRALDPMREQEWGRIVNFGFADCDRTHTPPVNFPYFVAKTGVLMFTRMLAYDTQDDGITVNAVSPFAVENTVSDVGEYPRGRPASFEDVVAPILFFASDEAAYLSGENVAVDGGRLPEA